MSLAVVASCAAAAAAIAGSPGSAVAEPRASVAEVQTRVAALHHEAEQAAERYNDARVRQEGVRLQLTEVTHRLQRAERDLAALRVGVGQMAVATYKSGGVDPSLELLLSDAPESFLERASALDQISRHQRESLRRISVARQQLSQDRAAVAARRGQLAELEAELLTEKQAVESRLREADHLLSTLKAEDRARIDAARRAAAVHARAQRAAAPRASRGARTAPRAHASSRPAVSRPSYNGPASGRASVAVRTAYAQLGDPYRWGAAGPSSFDCSGLTMYSWRAAGVSLPHSSSAQFASGRKVSRSSLRPGDLVFFYSPISHVGIYIGNGRMIDAPYPGASVKITSISSMPYSGAVRP